MTAKAKKLYQSSVDAMNLFIDDLLEQEAFDISLLRDYLSEESIPDPVVKKYDYRCVGCGRLAFRAYLPENARVATRCAKCGRMLTFTSNGKKVEIAHETETVASVSDGDDNKAAPE